MHTGRPEWKKRHHISAYSDGKVLGPWRKEGQWGVDLDEADNGGKDRSHTLEQVSHNIYGVAFNNI